MEPLVPLKCLVQSVYAWFLADRQLFDTAVDSRWLTAATASQIDNSGGPVRRPPDLGIRGTMPGAVVRGAMLDTVALARCPEVPSLATGQPIYVSYATAGRSTGRAILPPSVPPLPLGQA